MGLVKWSAQYQVDHPQIDDEHRYLFELINEFYDAFTASRSRTDVARLLNRLVEYSESHFQHEEKLMRDTAYPGLAEHRLKHKQLFEKIFQLNEKFEDRALNPTHDTISFLKNWIGDHILHDDVALAKHLRHSKAAAPAEAP